MFLRQSFNSTAICKVQYINLYINFKNKLEINGKIYFYLYPFY